MVPSCTALRQKPENLKSRAVAEAGYILILSPSLPLGFPKFGLARYRDALLDGADEPRKPLISLNTSIVARWAACLGDAWRGRLGAGRIGAASASPGSTGDFAMPDQSNVLATKLEALTDLALDKLDEVLRRTDPLDEDDGRLVRSQTSAAAVALNVQLRADSLRMRAARHDKALERLIELIAAKETTTPCGVERDASSLLDSAG